MIARVALVSAIAAIAASLFVAPAALAAERGPAITVKTDRARIPVTLGQKFSFRTTITNRGSRPATDLIAHLNVLSLRGDVYVDPEDWSTERTKYLDPIAPGRSTTIAWGGQAVSSGSVGLYVAVLDRSGSPRAPATGSAIRMDVTARTTLNAGGLIPLTLGIPGFLALLSLAISLSRRIRKEGRS